MSRFCEMGHEVCFLGCVGKKSLTSLTKTGLFRGKGRFVNLSYSPFSERLEWLRRLWMLTETRRWLPSDKTDITLWVTHPALLPAAKAMPHSRLVFDAMDPFTLFEKHDRDRYIANTLTLCRKACAVFTGGHTMHEQLTGLLTDNGIETGHVRCFPSGIEWKHFAYATDSAMPVHPFVARLPKPVWGYFGAIDERVDCDLIRRLCEANASGSIVLAGPQLRQLFSESDAPDNLVLPGALHYDELPALLKGFDVCLLPFKDTELVRQLSPTKTPEYLAGHKPVVSTPIPDVQNTWGDLVHIAHSADAFVQYCRTASPPTDKQYAQARQLAPEWDTIAKDMFDFMLKRSETTS